jgi:hypothetical protein
MPKRKVKIRAADDGAGGVDFEVDGVKAKHARLKLDRDSGQHEIEFELHDQSGLNLTFDSEDPLWIGENCPCPPPQGVNSDQVQIANTAAQSLTALNANSGAARELRYQLNFVAKDGSRQVCDPIMENGGGIKPFN